MHSLAVQAKAGSLQYVLQHKPLAALGEGAINFVQLTQNVVCELHEHSGMGLGGGTMTFQKLVKYGSP